MASIDMMTGAAVGVDLKVNIKILSLTSLVLGLALVYLVGLSDPMPLHNAAHDARHAAAFPCH